MAASPDWEFLFSDAPQAEYSRRAAAGIVVDEEAGIASISAMNDVLAVNRHKGVTSKAPDDPPTLGGVRPLIPLDLDGAEHTKFRKLLDPLFSPKRMALLESPIRSLADELIDVFVEDGRVELFEALCQPIPSTTFITMLGLPLSEMDTFLRFKDYAIRAPGDTPEEQAANRDAAGRAMADRLSWELQQRRDDGQRGDDLIDGFMDAEVDGHRLSDDEIVDIVYLLVIAGLDTVTAALSCVFRWLAIHPAEQVRLRDDPALLTAAMEELLRFESPVPGGGRYAAEDIEINGAFLAAGTRLVMSWSSANVDVAAFDDPLAVDLGRAANRHIAFASGFHRCLGSHLARVELRAVVDQFHQRTRRYWITEGESPRMHNIGVRTVEYLPVTFETI